ncbi:hypothetical protein JTB14_003216 [Gonioctena quinquepunctata]|nr:hypothetical protein JTB14_003216 [Gonioctena quinquepunctata]
MHFYRQSPTNNTKSVPSEKRLDVSVKCVKIFHLCTSHIFDDGVTFIQNMEQNSNREDISFSQWNRWSIEQVNIESFGKTTHGWSFCDT